MDDDQRTTPADPNGSQTEVPLQEMRSQSSFRLFDLPQELQDEIFSLAYAGTSVQDASKTLPSTTNNLDALLSTVPSPPASSNAASRVGVLFRPKYRAIVFELKLKQDMPFKLR